MEVYDFVNEGEPGPARLVVGGRSDAMGGAVPAC